VEGDIDRLIFKLMVVGGLEEVEDALRRGRRGGGRSPKAGPDPTGARPPGPPPPPRAPPPLPNRRPGAAPPAPAPTLPGGPLRGPGGLLMSARSDGSRPSSDDSGQRAMFSGSEA